VAELIDLAQASGGAKTHIAHFHGESKLLSALLDKASDAGVPMTFDSYPYLRGCSLLAMVSLPTWLPLADPIATLDLIANDEETKTKLLGHLATLDDLWPRTTLGWADGYDWVAGLTIPEIAAKMGVTPAQAALELLVGTKLKASCVFEQPPTNSQASVMALADRPEHIAGSDAIYVPFEAAGRPHPRGWGALVRWLKLKVAPWEAAQQEQTEAGWTWAEAVEHLSTRAVRRFGLGQRGKIEVGAIADLVVVNPARLADTATYEHPRSLATGIDDVWVAGRQVLKGGELTGETPGSGLRWEGNSR
ncbi:MAG: amidohydrolase family protein, partial [Cellulomonadaceae bacterium]|nr:amidohydrolase family protein [Cellulomonadaceae bacterium]